VVGEARDFGLTVPATMLQSSPIASLTMLGSLAASSPTILEVRRMAVSVEQWMVVALLVE
jgi:hypothetical protein